MTNIAYLRGIERGNPPADFSRTIVPGAALDPLQMTKGEMKLALLADQLRLVGSYYDNAGQKRAAEIITDLLAQGFHNAAPITTGVPGVDAAIRKAQRQKRPASGAAFIRKNRAAGLPEAAIAGIQGQATIGEVLIPFQSCDEYIEYPSFNPYDPYAGVDTSRPTYLPGYNECRQTQEYIGLLNTKLAPSSHHLLYEYVGAGEPGAVSAKRVLHRNAVSNLAKVTKLDLELFRGWLRNGVIRNNTINGLDPLQPEDTYAILKQSSQASVGELIVTLTAIGKLLAILIGAISATAALIGALKNPDKMLLQNSAQGIGTPTFGPEKDDFFQSQQPSGNFIEQNKNILLPAAAGLAVLLIAK
jgi:hypothetical protein